jgi:hypothetical protein
VSNDLSSCFDDSKNESVNSYIASFWNHNKNDNTLRTRYDTWQKERVVFFKPYQDSWDFVETLSDPLVIPLTHGFISAFIGAASIGMAAVGVGALVFGLAAGAFGNSDLSRASFQMAVFSANLTAVLILQSIVLAFTAVLSIPISLATLTTRSAASVVATINDSLPENKYMPVTSL